MHSPFVSSLTTAPWLIQRRANIMDHATWDAWWTAGYMQATWDAWWWQDDSAWWQDDSAWSEQAVSAYWKFWDEVTWWHQDWCERNNSAPASSKHEKFWTNYDHQYSATAGEDQSWLWWSHRKNRETELGPAFQNYRKSVEHKLTQWRSKKRMFGLWRWAAALFSEEDRPLLQQWQTLTVDDRVFSDDDLRTFLTTVVTFKAHEDWHHREKRNRQGPSHPLHHKAMSLLIPPSLVKLWQLCLAVTHSQSHAGEYMFYYGEEPSRLLLASGVGAQDDHRSLIKELSRWKGVRYYTYLSGVVQRYQQQPGSSEWLKDRFDYEQKQVKKFERMWEIKANQEAGEPWPPFAELAQADGVSTSDPAGSAAEATPEAAAVSTAQAQTDPELDAIAAIELAHPKFAPAPSIFSGVSALRVIAGPIDCC